MKINELLMNIHRKDFNIEKELQVKKYLPIEAKKTIAQGIIYECTNEEDGAIKVDSVQRYLSYVRYMITMHTNLKYTDADYDVLCSTEYQDTTLLNAIVKTFESDANECNRILGLMMNDYLDNNATENQLIMAVTQLVNGLVGITNTLEKKVADIQLDDILPQGFDINKLNDFLNKV
jgi:hypothetical protein